MFTHALVRLRPVVARSRSPFSHESLAVLLALAVGAVLAWPALGEEKKDTRPKIPPPEDMDLETRDGVVLKATFYASTLGKDAVPILTLHDYEGSRADFAPLASVLQALGHAVITVDLRGHGGSTVQKNVDRELKASNFSPADFRRMLEDAERAKRVLMEKNNQGELNIEKLCVVGVGMGATLALEWTLMDWSWPQLPTMKQGRDVKGLVLISPEFAFRGLSAANAFKHPQVARDVAVLILVGDQRPKSVSEAKRIHGMFERPRPKPEKDADLDLFYGPLKTILQGAKLIDEKNLKTFKIDAIIGRFIQVRLADQSYPWTDRRSPLEKARN